MYRIIKFTSLVVTVAMASLVLFGCVQKPEEEVTTEWEGKESFSPASDSLTGDALALSQRYDE